MVLRHLLCRWTRRGWTRRTGGGGTSPQNGYPAGRRGLDSHARTTLVRRCTRTLRLLEKPGGFHNRHTTIAAVESVYDLVLCSHLVPGLPQALTFIAEPSVTPARISDDTGAFVRELDFGSLLQPLSAAAMAEVVINKKSAHAQSEAEKRKFRAATSRCNELPYNFSIALMRSCLGAALSIRTSVSEVVICRFPLQACQERSRDAKTPCLPVCRAARILGSESRSRPDISIHRARVETGEGRLRLDDSFRKVRRVAVGERTSTGQLRPEHLDTDGRKGHRDPVSRRQDQRHQRRLCKVGTSLVYVLSVVILTASTRKQLCPLPPLLKSGRLIFLFGANSHLTYHAQRDYAV